MLDAGKFDLDMTMMFAVHDALRRELERIARVTARTTGDPRTLLRTAVGWETFKAYLRVHHTTEDDVLWPTLQTVLADRPDDLALLTALEADHAAIDPLLDAVDAALADPGLDRLGDLTDALAASLTGHLRREEEQGLPLIDSVLTEEQWAVFGQEHGKRVVSDASRYLPWLLDGRSDEAEILDRMPAPFRVAYRDQWRSAYQSLTLWPGEEVDSAS